MMKIKNYCFIHVIRLCFYVVGIILLAVVFNLVWGNIFQEYPDDGKLHGLLEASFNKIEPNVSLYEHGTRWNALHSH